MDSSNYDAFPLSTSIKPSIKGVKRSNNENELSPEMASKLKSPSSSKKQLPTKNFMSPTISAANRASVPRKKILGERNETLDFIEQTSHLTSTSFGSKPMESSIVDAADDNVLQPYDPITNYLSPRPRFLRYNPNRRRNMLGLQGNEECVQLCSSYELPSSGLEAGVDSSFSSSSSSTTQSVEDSKDVVNKEDDGDEAEEEEDDDGEETEEEEEMVEFGEDRCFSLKGFLKVLFVVITLILTTQAICSMNSPTLSQTLESLWSFSDHYNNVQTVAGLNFSEVGYDLVKEPDLLVGRSKDGNVCHAYEGLDMIEAIEDLVSSHQDEVVSKEVENDEKVDVTQDEILQENEIVASEVVESNNVEAEKEVNDVNKDEILQENGTATKGGEIINVEAEKEVDDVTQDYLIEENDSNAECKITQDMKEMVKKEDKIESIDVLTKLASFDPIFAVSIGLSILILTALVSIIIIRSKRKISIYSTPVSTAIRKEKTAAEKQGIKIPLQLALNPSSSVQQIDDKQQLVKLRKEVTKEISHIHAPSVELLGEFVFGEEVTSNISASDSMIQPTATPSSSQTIYSHIEMSTGDSYTVKKQKRKKAEVVTPSSVRRSSRLQSRTSS